MILRRRPGLFVLLGPLLSAEWIAAIEIMEIFEKVFFGRQGRDGVRSAEVANRSSRGERCISACSRDSSGSIRGTRGSYAAVD